MATGGVVMNTKTNPDKTGHIPLGDVRLSGGCVRCPGVRRSKPTQKAATTFTAPSLPCGSPFVPPLPVWGVAPKNCIRRHRWAS